MHTSIPNAQQAFPFDLHLFQRKKVSLFSRKQEQQKGVQRKIY